MRMILAALSERAAADSRKCCHEDRPEKTKPLLFLPGSVAEYKPDFAGGGCYMIPDFSFEMMVSPHCGRPFTSVGHGRAWLAINADDPATQRVATFGNFHDAVTTLG